MRNKKKNVFLVIGLLGLSFTVFGLANKGNADAEKHSDNQVKEIKQERLEKELHSDEYYKEQIQSEMDTIDVAVSDMKRLIKSDGISEKEVDEWRERIKEYGDVLNEYQKKYNYGEYSSLEDLFQQEHNKVLQLNEYFEEKYTER